MATQHINLEIKATDGNYMWFRSLADRLFDEKGHMLDPKRPVVNASLNYDFERRPDNEWLLYVDIGLRVRPIAEIKTRAPFQIFYEGPMEHILGTKAMEDVVNIATRTCLRAFNEQCAAHGIAYRHERIEMDAEGALKYIRENYASEHKPMEGTWFTQPFATFTPGGKTQILCKVPFMIMDEVFFSDQEFDHRYNASILFKHIPEPFYYTTKLRCGTIDHGDVSLQGTHSVYYLICLDAALQLLVGDHAERFDHLKENGLTADTVHKFLTWGTEYFDYMQKTFKESNFRITNFDNRPDWNAVVR